MAKVLQVFEKCSFLGHASDWVACYEHPTSWWCESRYHSTIDQSTIEPAGCRSSLGQLSIAHNYTEAPCVCAWYSTITAIANGYNQVIKKKCFAKTHNILICLHKLSESGLLSCVNLYAVPVYVFFLWCVAIK